MSGCAWLPLLRSSLLVAGPLTLLVSEFIVVIIIIIIIIIIQEKINVAFSPK